MSNKISLERGLNFNGALSLVIGTVIGTGVFLKAAVMTQQTGSTMWVLLAWMASGLLSLAGAFCFAELGSRFPHAGGEYVYLREAFGGLPAFLNGWMRFCIGNPGSIAAYAVGMMTFLNGVFHFSGLTQTMLSVCVIILFSLINCATIRATGLLQTCMTSLKIFLILGLTSAIFYHIPEGKTAEALTITGSWPGWKAFGAAMLAALWAYDGWNGMPMAAGEVKSPQRNIPRALVIGMLGIMLIYLFANLAYFAALPLEEIKNSNSPDFHLALPVATKAASITLGGPAVSLVSVLLAFSALVSLNGSILTGARVPFAMARDKIFFKSLGEIHPRTRTPIVSVIVQGLIAIALACSGTFDQLTDYVMFASWIFYALAVLALFIVRKKNPTGAGFLVPGFPFVPIVFLIVSVWLILNTLITAPTESLIGVLFIATGIPVYYFFLKKQRNWPT